MGSLPNLHELGRQDVTEQGYKRGPALGHLCGGCNGILSSHEKTKILHRYSGHNRIHKARSNPQDSNKIVYDDFMVEHMATYSPISTRSRYNLNLQGATSKRRDSLNSSIGATSVRRLLAVVRGGPHGSQTGRSGGPVYTKKVLIANLVVVCISHLLCSAAYLPFLALQSSVSVWNHPLNESNVDVKVGSLLVSGGYMTASVFALIAPCVLKRIDASMVIAVCYGAMIVFYLSHLYPALYVTVPASLLLGIVQGLLSCAHISFLMILSHRVTGLFHEEDEESRHARRTCIIRRVARAFQGAHDFGLIVGSVLSAILITYTINLRNVRYGYENATVVTDDCFSNSSYNLPHCQNITQLVVISSSNLYDYNSFLEDIFDRTEDGRLCGSQACPISTFSTNSSVQNGGFKVLPTKSADILAGVYAGACGAALLLAGLGLDRIKMLIYQDPLERGEVFAALRAVKESFRDIRLQMSAPLAFFIGMEQAFMYADFSKSYVVCTIGIHRLNLVFLAMGLLQSLAACTLSMLLRTIRRYYVVAVGFTFHGCLLMVLNLWKPTEDDPALFYVISASWGVCNSIWEMLNFTLLTGQYADNWESAFANMAFFKFLGLSIAFAFHGLLCNYWKLYGLAFFMVLAVVPFAWLEVRLENIRKIRNITRL
ncbi:putative potassium channel regulatory protein unc-93 [Anoplophora glabripennis]|uniref:putative potassium channel regulatory protein unc-93 n=1 Tax=Anoplophora glabripennis TaxID=217634 RepID=UPI0008750E80|nr:putative potassium channel regulatory protein unc-93 [Anoplophora glabripennis]